MLPSNLTIYSDSKSAPYGGSASAQLIPQDRPGLLFVAQDDGYCALYPIRGAASNYVDAPWASTGGTGYWTNVSTTPGGNNLFLEYGWYFMENRARQPQVTYKFFFLGLT